MLLLLQCILPQYYCHYYFYYLHDYYSNATTINTTSTTSTTTTATTKLLGSDLYSATTQAKLHPQQRCVRRRKAMRGAVEPQVAALQHIFYEVVIM